MDWKQKPQVVDKAYEKGFDIKPTARKYGLYPHQIRLWKKRRCAHFKSKWIEKNQNLLLSEANLNLKGIFGLTLNPRHVEIVAHF